jgi:hypothetical protein
LGQTLMPRLRHYSIEVQGLQKCPNNHNMSHFQDEEHSDSWYFFF